jgi:NAD(P)-dependent dehydrogenase (short-subunit alcohol dehydrogenase family)
MAHRSCATILFYRFFFVERSSGVVVSFSALIVSRHASLHLINHKSQTNASRRESSNHHRLSYKSITPSGCGSGIGYESSFLFAKEVAKVVACDVNVSTGQAAVDKINAQIGKDSVVFHPCDVMKEADIKSAVDLAESKFGKLNIIFNNAGIMHPEDDNAETTSEKVWDLTMNINVKGVWYGCKHAIPALRRAGGGSIINTASFVGKLGAATPQLGINLYT